MKTIADLHKLIDANRRSPSKKLAEHAATLVGPRDRGSTTSKGIYYIDPDTPMSNTSEDVPNRDPKCRYYVFAVPEDMDARLGAIPLRLALAMGHKVCLREGDHGYELYLDQPAGKMPPVNFCTAIVGTWEGETALFTWHPGEPLRPLKDSNGAVTICDETAVKTHSG
jgi:hypothetical protein